MLSLHALGEKPYGDASGDDQGVAAEQVIGSASIDSYDITQEHSIELDSIASIPLVGAFEIEIQGILITDDLIQYGSIDNYALTQDHVIVADTIHSTGTLEEDSLILSGQTIVKGEVVSRRYYCTLTGSADNTTDILIPISSLSSRQKADTSCSITVVCPNGVDYAQSITARSNGGIKIKAVEFYENGQADYTDWPEYPITSLRLDQGARSYSITITANLTQTFPYSKSISVSGLSYIAQQANGQTTVRCSLDKDIQPNDTAIFPDETTLTIESITHIISTNNFYMELTG